MTAGRALDALVAEKVMGWKWASFYGNAYLLHPSDYDDHDPEKHPGLGWKDGKHGEEAFVEDHFIDSSRTPMCSFHEIRPYSTDIAAAWEVIEMLKGKRLGFTLCQWTPNSSDYEASFRESLGFLRHTGEPILDRLTTERYDYYNATADTAPLAICLAALKAVWYTHE